MTDRRIKAERGRYKRLLLAFHDSLEASAYLGRLNTIATRDRRSQDEEVMRGALLSALVISYGRCFGHSYLEGKPLPDTRKQYVKQLSPDERIVHDRLLVLRNKEFAHSEADAAAIEVSTWPDGTLVPESRVLRLHSVSDHDIATAAKLLGKLKSSLTEELLSLQGRLVDHGPF